jgi:hypothetical protein
MHTGISRFFLLVNFGFFFRVLRFLTDFWSQVEKPRFADRGLFFSFEIFIVAGYSRAALVLREQPLGIGCYHNPDADAVG